MKGQRRDALDEAIGLLDEIYAHVGPDGNHLPGPEVKISVHRSTIDRLGDWLVANRDAGKMSVKVAPRRVNVRGPDRTLS